MKKYLPTMVFGLIVLGLCMFVYGYTPTPPPNSSSDCYVTYFKNSSTTLLKGELVEVDSSTDYSVKRTTVSSYRVLGVVKSNCNRGATCTICLAGRTPTKLKNLTACTRGHYCLTANVAGRTDCSNTDAAPSTIIALNQMVGWSEQTESSGTDVLCIVNISK